MFLDSTENKSEFKLGAETESEQENLQCYLVKLFKVIERQLTLQGKLTH